MKQAALSLAAGLLLSLSFTVTATTLYVDINNSAPASPYTNWVTAATNIQDAVDVSIAGDEVLVADGVYATGERATYGTSNRVAVTQPIVVRSVNGPAVTLIKGSWVAGTTNGPAAVRCVYLTNGAALMGFTLTNGATLASGTGTLRSGGGVWCESVSAVVSNCVLIRNSANVYGGGAYQGTLYDSTLTGNSAQYSSGGGAYYAILTNCLVAKNTAYSYGGGTYYGTLHSCTVVSNTASSDGGGAYHGTLDNCTVAWNSARSAWGGGAYAGTLSNCSVISNSAGSGGGTC
jgi:hypothetical protein